MAKRGGPRANAGRKKNPAKELAPTGESTAARILGELKHEKEIKDLYFSCGDARLKTHIIFKLREWAYGKPSQPTEETHKFDENSPMHVIVTHIGSSNTASAKTK